MFLLRPAALLQVAIEKEFGGGEAAPEFPPKPKNACKWSMKSEPTLPPPNENDLYVCSLRKIRVGV